MHLYQRHGIYWLSVWHRKEKIRKSLGTKSKRKANQLAVEFLKELEELSSAKRTLFACLSDWYEMRQIKAKRIDTDRAIVQKFLNSYKDIPIHEVTNKYLEEHLEVSNPTFNRYVTVVMAAARLSAQKYRNPLPILYKKPIQQTRMRFLSQSEWLRLEKVLPDYLRPAVAFSLATGLRRNNVLNLKWSEVNRRSKNVVVWSDESKNKKQLIIPLSDWALEILKECSGKSKVYCFPQPSGEPIINPKRPFQKALDKAGIKEFRWHDLRHTFASWGLQNGMSLAELKELGGWSSLTMVMRYAHLAPSSLREATNRLKKPTDSGTLRAQSVNSAERWRPQGDSNPCTHRESSSHLYLVKNNPDKSDT